MYFNIYVDLETKQTTESTENPYNSDPDMLQLADASFLFCEQLMEVLESTSSLYLNTQVLNSLIKGSTGISM